MNASNGPAIFCLKCPPKIAATPLDFVHFVAEWFYALDANELSKFALSFSAIVILFKAIPADGMFHLVPELIEASLIASSLGIFFSPDAKRFSVEN
jgi:hypothetical protein